MANDLFHDAARAYYGIGIEVYTLANIATHGNAPASYALDGEDGEPKQDTDDEPADEKDEDEEKSPTGGKYVKPELPPITRQPKSSPGQKRLFPIDYSLTGTGTKVKVPESKNCAKSGCGKKSAKGKSKRKPEGKYAAAPPPPPPSKGTYGDLAKATKQLQGTGIHLKDLLSSTPTTSPTAAGTPVATPAATPVTPKPRISEQMKMAAQRIQQRHNAEQRVPPSNKAWT